MAGDQDMFDAVVMADERWVGRGPQPWRAGSQLWAAALGERTGAPGVAGAEKIRDTKGIFHAKMGSLKDRNCRDLTEAEDIKKR